MLTGMTWFVLSAAVSIGNAFLMVAYASSKLGPTPYFLPFFASVFTLLAFSASLISVAKGYKQASKIHWPHLAACVCWAVATGYNIWACYGLWYVL